MKVVRVREKRNGEVVKDQEFTNDQFAKYISGDQVVYENDLMQTSTFFIATEDITNLVRTTEMFKMYVALPLSLCSSYAIREPL